MNSVDNFDADAIYYTIGMNDKMMNPIFEGGGNKVRIR
jgi:hypothetical protein